MSYAIHNVWHYQTLNFSDTSGAFAKQRGLDVATCEKAALEMEELIVQTAEKHFFFEELESDGDRVHIDRDDVDEDTISTSTNHHNARTKVGGKSATLQIAYAWMPGLAIVPTLIDVRYTMYMAFN